VRIYEDKHKDVHILLISGKERKVLGPFRGRPIPVMRWSSLSRDEVYTTFSANGSCFTIYHYRWNGEDVETKTEMPIDDFQDVLAAGIETYYWEGWNTFTNTWEPHPRPTPLEWNGSGWDTLHWNDE